MRQIYSLRPTLTRGLQVHLRNPARFLSTAAQPASTSEWFQFPREKEGNIYDVNWSLCEHGVVPKGDAFRNARIPLLTTRLPNKVENGKVTLETPTYTAKYDVLESGDGISINKFGENLTVSQDHLSSGTDLFIEDGGLGALYEVRAGTRVVSANPALALIFKSLLVNQS